MKILAKGENTRKCSPGDIVTITESIYAITFPWFLSNESRIDSHDTYLEAFKVTKDKQNFKESFLTEEALEKV